MKEKYAGSRTVQEGVNEFLSDLSGNDGPALPGDRWRRGGGAYIANLLEAGAEVTVISPDVSENVAHWSKNNSIQLEAKCYQNGDLDGYELAFIATDDDRVNASIYPRRQKPRCLGQCGRVRPTAILFCLPFCGAAI